MQLRRDDLLFCLNNLHPTFSIPSPIRFDDINDETRDILQRLVALQEIFLETKFPVGFYLDKYSELILPSDDRYELFQK